MPFRHTPRTRTTGAPPTGEPRPARALRRTLLAGLAVAALTATTACGGGGSGGRTAGEPRRGGALTISLPAESRGLDPFTSSYVGSADSARMAALYDMLVYFDAESGQVRPRIAESLTPDDPAGATWTLKVRPGVRFSDGTAYDAAAVKANWDANLDPRTKSLRASSVAGVTTEVAGPLQLKITLAAPDLAFDRVVAYGLSYIASPTAFQADPTGFIGKPVGAGPFVLKEWVRGDHQTMIRNPAYWQPGLPHLDQVTFKVIPDNDQILNSIATGESHLTITSDSQIPEKARAKGLESLEAKLDGGTFTAFNLTRAPFDDVRARRAFALAIDPADMMKTLFNDQVEPGVGILRDGSPLLTPGTQQQPAYNPREAQRLFDELTAEGRPVNFTYLTQQHATARKTAEYLQSRLNRYRGVHMEIEALEVGAYTTKGLVTRDFQAQNFGLWEPDPHPGMDFMFRSTSRSNYGGYKSPDADRALDAAKAATTPDQRRAAYTDLVRALAQDVPVFVWQEAAQVVAHRKNVTGVEVVNRGALLMDQLALT